MSTTLLYPTNSIVNEKLAFHEGRPDLDLTKGGTGRGSGATFNQVLGLFGGDFEFGTSKLERLKI